MVKDVGMTMARTRCSIYAGKAAIDGKDFIAAYCFYDLLSLHPFSLFDTLLAPRPRNRQNTNSGYPISLCGITGACAFSPPPQLGYINILPRQGCVLVYVEVVTVCYAFLVAVW